MELLGFPPEALHIILVHAALGRRLKRALRLRLVCKTFEQLVYPALFETHMLEVNMLPTPEEKALGSRPVVLPSHGSESWHLENQHGAPQLWQRYFVFRCFKGK
jgi:hypothetical protein